MWSHSMPREVRFRHMSAARFVAIALTIVIGIAGCASSGHSSNGGSTGSTSAPMATMPRTRPAPTNGLRLEASSKTPVFMLNLAIGTTPEQVRETVANWPADLRWMLAFQVIYDAHNPLPAAERAPALNKILDVTDKEHVPTLVQVGTFLGWDGPTKAELADSFRAHASLAGVSLAELSAGAGTAITGLKDDGFKMILDAMNIAIENGASFLWADMGYVGPHVFLSAGANKEIADLMQAHPANMIIQAKQNGLGRRFGTWSAAFGFYAANFAGAWGVNSEDWLWWEASFEKLYGPQVPGGLTIAGMVKSKFPNRSRLTYPDALYGSEMLVAATSGASVYSIESPDRIVDATTRKPTVTAEKVVFPVLRELAGANLIPSRRQVMAGIEIAYQPESANPAELIWDKAFSGLYGPEGCTKADRISCAQGQWLPSTGRYGIIPTLPVLTPKTTDAKFSKVIQTLDGTDQATRKAFDAVYPTLAGGDSWVARGAVAGSWLLANPHENSDVISTFTLPERRGVEVSGTLSPQSFAVLTSGEGRIDVLIDDFRTDSDRLWTPAPTKDVPDDQTTAGPAAAPAKSKITVRVADSDKAPEVDATGGTVKTSWNKSNHLLTISLDARGPVRLAIHVES